MERFCTSRPGSVALGPNLESPGKGSMTVRGSVPWGRGTRTFSFTLLDKPDEISSVHVRSVSEEVSLSAVLTLFKDVDWVARRTATMLVVYVVTRQLTQYWKLPGG